MPHASRRFSWQRCRWPGRRRGRPVLAQHGARLEFHPAELRRLRGAHPGAGSACCSTTPSPTGTSSAARTWTGLANFQQMVHDASFWTALRNTALLHRLPHPAHPGRVARAWRCCSTASCGAVAFFRTVAFFPYITSIVAIAQVWNMLFSPELRADQRGAAAPSAWTIRRAGPPRRTGRCRRSSSSAPGARWATTCCSSWPACRPSRPSSTRPRRWTARTPGSSCARVTLPGLRPTTFFVTVMLTIGSFKVFDLILVMTNGGPGQSTLVLSQYIYQKGFDGEPVRLRLGRLHRAVRHLLPRHRRPVPGEQAEERLMNHDPGHGSGRTPGLDLRPAPRRDRRADPVPADPRLPRARSPPPWPCCCRSTGWRCRR